MKLPTCDSMQMTKSAELYAASGELVDHGKKKTVRLSKIITAMQCYLPQTRAPKHAVADLLDLLGRLDRRDTISNAPSSDEWNTAIRSGNVAKQAELVSSITKKLLRSMLAIIAPHGAYDPRGGTWDDATAGFIANIIKAMTVR